MEKYKKSYLISSFEVDIKQKLRLHSLFNIFQDLADNHAEKIGVGYTYCTQHGIGWVGGAYHLKINRLPTWGEEVLLETWPSGMTAASGIRDFRMTTAQGEGLLSATSQWVLIDTTRLRPIPAAKHLPPYELVDDRVFVSDFGKIEVPETISTIRTFPVHVDDIDLNNHVNNALYPTWALDGVDADFLMTHTPAELQVSFKRSARLGDQIVLKTYTADDTTVSVLTNAEETIEFARVKIIWKGV